METSITVKREASVATLKANQARRSTFSRTEESSSNEFWGIPNRLGVKNLVWLDEVTGDK